MLHIFVASIEQSADPTSSVWTQIGIALSWDDNSDMTDNIKEQLLSQGGMDQLLLFLTGPTGVGKTTAIKAAEGCCYESCSSCNIM